LQRISATEIPQNTPSQLGNIVAICAVL